MKKLKYIDYQILVSYLVLSLAGTLMVYSSSSYVALSDFNNPQHYFIRQLVYVGMGLASAGFVFFLKHRLLKNKGIIMMAVLTILILLIYLLLFGEERNGARGWLSVFGFFNLQPAEFAKLVLIWYLAYIFSKRQHKFVSGFKNFMKSILAPGMVLGLISLLVFHQPDLGGALIILGIGGVMILSSGYSARFGFSIGLVGALAVYGLTFLIREYGALFLEPYQYNRFLAFWDPFALAETSGHQLVMSYYALGQGGILGRGIGESVQKTGYLPEPYTDFIISIVGEETGLLGVLLVLSLFTFLVLKIFLIGIRSKDAFSSLLCIGIASMLLIQGSINLGGVTGLMPITGVTFPFVSYGGSSTIMLALSIGIVLNAKAETTAKEAEKKKQPKLQII